LVKEIFKNDDMQQKDFLQDLGLLNVKNNVPLQFVESVWSKHLILHLCPRAVFLFRKKDYQEILPNLVGKKSICFAKITILYFYHNKL
jgi:hypothetical protein